MHHNRLARPIGSLTIRHHGTQLTLLPLARRMLHHRIGRNVLPFRCRLLSMNWIILLRLIGQHHLIILLQHTPTTQIARCIIRLRRTRNNHPIARRRVDKSKLTARQYILHNTHVTHTAVVRPPFEEHQVARSQLTFIVNSRKLLGLPTRTAVETISKLLKYKRSKPRAIKSSGCTAGITVRRVYIFHTIVDNVLLLLCSLPQ